jgi:hypothetical protein
VLKTPSVAALYGEVLAEFEAYFELARVTTGGVCRVRREVGDEETRRTDKRLGATGLVVGDDERVPESVSGRTNGLHEYEAGKVSG